MSGGAVEVEHNAGRAESADHYLACLALRGRHCLLVGGGETALEKAEALLAAGASLTVVATRLEPRFSALPVEVIEREFRPSDLDDCWLVVATTAHRLVNEEIFREAEQRRIFCNVADVPDLCSFILPALHRRGLITVAVSTAGASPALAQWLRDHFAAMIGPKHEQLAQELQSLRPWAKENLASYEERRDFFRRRVTETLG